MMRMYTRGVPEKLIAEKSGHRSVDALCMHERTSSDLEKAAGEVISDPGKCFEVKVDGKERTETAFALPGFSRLNHCTINFSINYGSSK